MDVIVGRGLVCLGVAFMVAAGTNTQGLTLASLTALGIVVVLVGLTWYYLALPPTGKRHSDPRRGSPWRFPVASGAVALAMALAVAPVLAHLGGARQELLPAAVSGFVLIQAWLVGRLDRALGRLGRRPRRRFLVALATSTLAATATTVLVSSRADLGLLRWPAFLDAAVVVVVTAVGSWRPSRSARPTTPTADLDLLSSGVGAGDS